MRHRRGRYSLNVTSAIIVIRGPGGKTISLTVRHDGRPVGLGEEIRTFLTKTQPHDISHNEFAAKLAQALCNRALDTSRWDGNLVYDWRYILSCDQNVWVIEKADWGPGEDITREIEEVLTEDPTNDDARDDLHWIQNFVGRGYEAPLSPDIKPPVDTDTPVDVGDM